MKRVRTSLKRDKRLFERIATLVEADLSHPKLETSARKVVSALRKKGYPLPSFDTEETQCLSCLHMTLRSAADLMWIPRHFH